MHVPQDVSVIGFDDITLASLVVPRLTTLRQPIEDIASVAVDRIVAKIAGPVGSCRPGLADCPRIHRTGEPLGLKPPHWDVLLR
jgi:DNA-binding LacI/PurR family transcriptional regulator